jgi:hypothetical protein
LIAFDVLAGIPGQLVTTIYATSTTGEIATFQGRQNDLGTFYDGGALAPYSTASTLYLGFVVARRSGSGTWFLSGASVELLSQ